MKGLPPVPADVFRLTQDWFINGLTCSTSWWLFDPVGLFSMPENAPIILAAYLNTCLPSLLELQHNGVMPSTCRLAAQGMVFEEAAPPAVGGWEGGQATSTAIGIKWILQGHSRRAWSYTWLPGVPSVFIANNWQINELGYGNIQASATDFINAMNELSYGLGSKLVFCCLQRARGGAPLPSAEVSPVLAASPTRRIAGCDRRIPRHGGFSPTP